MKMRIFLSLLLTSSLSLSSISSAEAYSLTGSCIKATVKSAYPLQTPAESSTARYQISYINTCEQDISSVEIGIGVLVTKENKVITTGGVIGLVKSYQSGSLNIDLKHSEYRSYQKFNFLIKEVKSKSLTFVSTAVIEFASGSTQSPFTSTTPSPAAVASQELMYSQDVGGVIFSWPQSVYAPQSLDESRNAKFVMQYRNNSGKDLYYIGYSLKTSGSYAEDLKIPPLFAISVPIKNGASGKFETSLSYSYFLNVQGPIDYTMNLCHTESLLSKETCQTSDYPLTFVTTAPNQSSSGTPAPAPSPSKAPTTTSNSSTSSPSKPKTVYLTIHYQRPAGDYSNWQLWLWRNLDAGLDSNVNASGSNFTGIDGFGKVATLVIDNMEKYDNIGLIVRRGEWLEKDLDIDRFITKFESDGRSEIWLRQGDPAIYYSEPSPTKIVSDAESNAKKEAEAKAAAEKAATELKAKQDADAKIMADKAAAEKLIADAKSEAARILAEANAKAAVTKKTTITCVKGKLTKKVTAVKPVCPKGYKKK